MQPKYYAMKAYPINGFPKFFDSYKTKEQVVKAANDLLKDGYYVSVEIYKDLPKQPGYFGIERELITTLGETV